MKMKRFVAVVPALVVAFGVHTAHAQGGWHVNVHVPDSVAHVVDRAQPSAAVFGIVSRDGTAALLLLDTTIVAQLTDTGLARMNSREVTDTIKGGVDRLLARMALGALQPLFDHGIAYHLSDMGDAEYSDNRLKIFRHNGDEVFRDVEVGRGPLMESFAADDAKTFARLARAAKRHLTH